MLKNFSKCYSSPKMIMIVKCENESDLEDEDYMEVHSEDSDTKQHISSEDELDMRNVF